MVGLAFHNFVSAASGIAVAAALVRGIARHTAKTIGNFWTDLVRIHLYVLLPICLLYAIFLVSQGMIQNFKPYESARLVEPMTVEVPKTDAQGQPVKDAKGEPVTEKQVVETQTIVQGPMASQVAIKMLGTNGGGYVNANASHPYENPTPLSNFLQILSIFLIPSGLTYYLGRMVKNQRHGWAVWGAMAFLFLAGILLCWGAESAGNPRLHALGVNPAYGNMEGKEVRFGIFNSALFATVTTDASCGAVNSMHDSFTPLGGLVPLINMQLGEVVFGGVGAGLYGMLVFVVLTVFLAGLMVGRTPEYLGKKIESYDVKVSALAVLILIIDIMGFTAWAAVSQWGLAGLNNAGPHGLSEMLYAYSSATGNNGSAFAGLTGNTYWYNTTLGIAMLIGRFFFIVPVLALAGNLAKKKIVPESGGSFPVSGVLFALLLVGTVLIVGVLSFFPALSLGPIVEHFLMVHSNVVF
jgi:K+-transporting ATPase ATPase A chain